MARRYDPAEQRLVPEEAILATAPTFTDPPRRFSADRDHRGINPPSPSRGMPSPRGLEHDAQLPTATLTEDSGAKLEHLVKLGADLPSTGDAGNYLVHIAHRRRRRLPRHCSECHESVKGRPERRGTALASSRCGRLSTGPPDGTLSDGATARGSEPPSRSQARWSA
jgi:hypothetical protein